MGERNESSSSGETGGQKAGSGEQRRPSDDSGGDPDGGDGNRIYHRKVTPEAEEANQSLLRLLANIENCEVTDLPPLYEQVDHMVEKLFSSPPPADAQAELEFSYHGYRIELDQTGNVSFLKLAERTPVEPEE